MHACSVQMRKYCVIQVPSHKAKHKANFPKTGNLCFHVNKFIIRLLRPSLIEQKCLFLRLEEILSTNGKSLYASSVK